MNLRDIFRLMSAIRGSVQGLSSGLWRVLLVALLIVLVLVALGGTAESESEPLSGFLQAPDQSTVPQPVWTCDGIPATIVGTPGSETLKGTSAADVIVAREGNDIIRGLGGDDIICAGKGNDIVYGGAGYKNRLTSPGA